MFWCKMPDNVKNVVMVEEDEGGKVAKWIAHIPHTLRNRGDLVGSS